MLRGKKVTLRMVRESDLDTLLAALSNLQNLGDYYLVHLTSEVDFRKQFQEHGFWSEDNGSLLICAEDKIVGRIKFFRSVPYYDGLELGFILFDAGRRNKGLMTEAVSLLANFLFATRKINRLQMQIHPSNLASKRVAVKCGFKFEGTARGALFHEGKNCDVEIYSLLRTDERRDSDEIPDSI